MDARPVGGRTAVSHRQAFHTSCRTGLSGISGFQINAATPDFHPEQLAALVRAHARYETPPDTPYEPTVEEMRSFPVALRASDVPSVGAVVSRTEYVGREYRGRGQQPDEGRFGNYFCHMVVAAPDGEPFDGLSPIELWDAPHWTINESESTTLPALNALQPGPLDIAVVAEVVRAAPRGVPEAVLDGALESLGGGPPLLLIEPDHRRSAAWIAWITFALPRETASELTFSTFEGRPSEVLDLHVIVTTPACDLGTSYSRHTRIDVTVPSKEAGSLYARTATSLATKDVDRMLRAVGQLGARPREAWGAGLAIAGEITDEILPEDLPGVLDELRAMVSDGKACDVAEATSMLSELDAADGATVGSWAALHRAARSTQPDDAARSVASLALERVLDHIDALPADTPMVPAHAPVQPEVRCLGAWLRMAEAAEGEPQCGTLLGAGLHLGLLGLNVPVDERISGLIARQLPSSSVVAALDAFASSPGLQHIVERVAVLAVEVAPSRMESLALLARYDGAEAALRHRAEENGSFDAHLIWQRLRVVSNRTECSSAARHLAPLAVDDGARAEIRELWGPSGPTTAAQVRDLIAAYLEAGGPVPSVDVENGFQALMSMPLLDPADSIRDALGHTLARLPAEQRERRRDFWAWGVTAHRPTEREVPLLKWSRKAVFALESTEEEVPNARWNEVWRVVVQVLTACRGEPDFPSSLSEFRTVDFRPLLAEIGAEVASEVQRASERSETAATEFERWVRLPVPEAAEELLPVALAPLSSHDIDGVAGRLPEALQPLWGEWVELNPREGARKRVGRAVGRLRGGGARA